MVHMFADRQSLIRENLLDSANMSSHSTSTAAKSTADLEASFSDVRKRRTEKPVVATATVTSGNDYKAPNGTQESSSGPSYESAGLAKEEISNKPKPKPAALNLSVSNVYCTHAPSGKGAVGSPGSPTACDLM